MHDHYMMEGSLFSVLVVASRDGIPFVTLTPLCLFGFVLSTALSAPIVFFFFFYPFSFPFLYPGFPMLYWTLAVPLAHPPCTNLPSTL